MKTFPLIRTKLSNEHIMALVFAVLVLFQIPQWTHNPLGVFSFLGVLAIGLLVDTVFSMKRNNSLKCAVSASVTVGIIYALYPTIPFWGGLLGVAVALVFGKHLLGGTGKNILNPAMVGVVVLNFIFPTGSALFSNNYIIFIAMLFSLPFILMRPFASIGLMIGMLISMKLNNSLSVESIISTGVIFWGCMVVTDPVTITYRPIVGAVGALCIGVVAILLDGVMSAGTMALLILSLNLISVIADKIIPQSMKSTMKKTKIKKPYKNIIWDSTDSKAHQNGISEINMELTAQDILEKIENSEVVGLGGAAFWAYLKIQSVMNAVDKEKFLIVNAIECDPGLVHDAWVLREYPEEIYKGVQLICECIPSCNVILATKDTTNLNFQGKINVKKVPNFYPNGAEKRLIRHVLGKELPHDVIPAQKGILVLNVQTIYSIYEAVWLNKKATSKFVTVADLIKKEAQVVKVELGSKVSEAIDTVYNGQQAIFVGGGLMQARHVDEYELIEKSTNFIAVGQIPRYKDGNCSKCGICAARCPSGLAVYKIASFVDDDEIAKAAIFNPERCISCGICSYYCLAGINLSRKIKRAKEFNRLSTL